MTLRDDLVLKFGSDRVLAHQSLFAHRHPDPTPPFHDQLIGLWHSPTPRVLTLAFRSGGKSTLAEEALVLIAAQGLVRNILIIGSNSDRANDRLRAIKYEFETNEDLIDLYGNLHGSVWNEGRIVLANGVCVQAFGRGQALRGVKHLDMRPDFCFCDDLEEEEHIRTPEARQETLRWFMRELIPVLDKNGRIRVNATPLDREALPMVLSRQPGWITKIYPIEYIDPQGVRRATWPSRFPLKWVEEKREEFLSLGLQAEFSQEYLCVPEDPTTKVFLPSTFQLKPRTRTYEPVFVCYDPARTVKAGSAMTGWAAWSPVGKRLIVWDGGAEFWKPDEIIEHIFKVNDEYSPVLIGVEVNGLEEFILQPLRQEQLRRGVILPVVGLRAPKGKLQFIAGLQPFLQSGDISFAKDISALKQFYAFPTGKIDFPNALAYALKLRPDVTYDGFSMHNVAETLSAQGGSSVYLCLNATRTVTTAVAVQFVAQALHVLGDWIREREPGAVVGEIIRDASKHRLEPFLDQLAPGPLDSGDAGVQRRGDPAVAPAFARIRYVRLQQDARLRQQLGGTLAFANQLVEPIAFLRVEPDHVFLDGNLFPGHESPPSLPCRDRDPEIPVMINGRGRLATVGDDVYQLLMEGLESFVGTGQLTGEPAKGRYAIGRDGRRYLTASPHLAEPNLPTKDRWWEDVETDRPQTALPLGHPFRH